MEVSFVVLCRLCQRIKVGQGGQMTRPKTAKNPFQERNFFDGF